MLIILALIAIPAICGPIEDLQAAFEAVRSAAIEQAVAEGLITREQADEMWVWGGPGPKGFDFRGFGRGRGLWW